VQSWGRALAVVLVAAGLGLAMLTAPARGQTPEQILDYTVDLQIEAAGTLLVSEQIAYDFGTTRCRPQASRSRAPSTPTGMASSATSTSKPRITWPRASR
jgi:hypothetical protein